MLKEEQSEHGLVRFFLWNDREYSAVNKRCFRDDATVLLKAILQQAVNDYVKLSCKTLTKEEDKLNLKTSKAFLFDNEYHINYGGMDITVRDVVYYLTGNEPNMIMFRAGIERQRNANKKKR